MGQFASTVEYYNYCREPYSPRFFEAIAERLSLTGDEALLDIGCGPGMLAFGLSRFVGSCTGLDPEPAMIEAARQNAENVGIPFELHLGHIEDYAADRHFNLATIGRALHWLDPQPTLAVLERIIPKSGFVLICAATSVESSLSPWLKPYQEVCDSWSNGPRREWYRINVEEWFFGSGFELAGQISVSNTQSVSISDLIGRALSWSTTSPDALGPQRGKFERDLGSVLRPFAREGGLHEEVASRATVLARSN